MGTSGNIIILPRCRRCECQEFTASPAPTVEATMTLTPVGWSKARGFYWSPDGAYYRRADVDAKLAAEARGRAPQEEEPLDALAREFVRYWTTDRTPDGCGMCGGIPHSTTCYVGRMASLLARGRAAETPEATR
jgi:hypothetical protein